MTPNLLGVAAAGLLRRSCVAMPMDPSECVAPVLMETVMGSIRLILVYDVYGPYMAPFLLILDSCHSRL